MYLYARIGFVSVHFTRTDILMIHLLYCNLNCIYTKIHCISYIYCATIFVGLYKYNKSEQEFL